MGIFLTSCLLLQSFNLHTKPNLWKTIKNTKAFVYVYVCPQEILIIIIIIKIGDLALSPNQWLDLGVGL